jgi:hypothetical protein
MTDTYTTREQAVPSHTPFGSRSSAEGIGQDLVNYLTDYARTYPERAALWCFGIGFILGWKLKPW